MTRKLAKAMGLSAAATVMGLCLTLLGLHAQAMLTIGGGFGLSAVLLVRPRVSELAHKADSTSYRWLLSGQLWLQAKLESWFGPSIPKHIGWEDTHQDLAQVLCDVEALAARLGTGPELPTGHMARLRDPDFDVVCKKHDLEVAEFSQRNQRLVAEVHETADSIMRWLAERHIAAQAKVFA